MQYEQYEPPTNPSLWQVFLADEEGCVTTAAAALDEYGPESHVEVSIRRLSALPRPTSGGWWLTGRPDNEDDIAVEWKLDMVDDIGETDHIEAQLNAARAMAAGLNGALANAGDWNRSTELAATLHELADRLAAYPGLLPKGASVYLSLDDDVRTPEGTATLIADIDRLGLALTGTAGKTKSFTDTSNERRSSGKIGPVRVDVWGIFPKPADEDPEVLKARIAELEAKLTGGETK